MSGLSRAAAGVLLRFIGRGKSLRDYQTGSRKKAIMAGFAATLSEQDIAVLAAFYASQPGALEDLSHLE